MYTLIYQSTKTGEKFSQQLKTMEEVENKKIFLSDGFTFEVIDEEQEKIKEQAHESSKKSERELRISQLKSIDWTSVDTVKELKDIVKILVNKELKDEK